MLRLKSREFEQVGHARRGKGCPHHYREDQPNRESFRPSPSDDANGGGQAHHLQQTQPASPSFLSERLATECPPLQHAQPARGHIPFKCMNLVVLLCTGLLQWQYSAPSTSMLIANLGGLNT